MPNSQAQYMGIYEAEFDPRGHEHEISVGVQTDSCLGNESHEEPHPRRNLKEWEDKNHGIPRTSYRTRWSTFRWHNSFTLPQTREQD